MKRIVLAAAALFCLQAQLFPVLFTDREVIVNPLLWNIPDDFSFEFNGLAAAGLYGEFAGYVPTSLSDPDHAWKAKLGGFLELFRIGNMVDSFISSESELIADPFSPINFYPRSLFWSEGLVIAYNHSWFTLQTGYYHRCKHDFDSLRLIIISNSSMQRGVIYDSVPLRLLSKEILIPLSSDAYPYISSFFYLKNDFFVLSQDDRIFAQVYNGIYSYPYSSSALDTDSIETLIDTVTIGAHNVFERCPYFGFYANLFVSLDIYGKNKGWVERFAAAGDLNLDYYLEAGLYLEGKIRLCFFITAEYQHDPMISVFPSSAFFIYGGLKCYDPSVME